MSKPFDATPKYLIDLQPSAWTQWFGYTSKRIKVCNVDLSTVTSSMDALLLVGGKRKEALHLEFQSNYDTQIGLRALAYNVLASRQLNVTVRSVVLLLRQEADGPLANGFVRKIRVDGKPVLEFYYDVVKVWEQSSEAILAGELGLIPLAFIADAKPEQIPGLVKRVAKSLARETERGKAGEIWTAVKVLMGMKYDEAFVDKSLKGISAMRESVTYQAILREGKAEGIATGIEKGIATGEAKGLREALLLIGAKRLGKPDAKLLAEVNRVGSVKRLKNLVNNVYTASNWKELFRK